SAIGHALHWGEPRKPDEPGATAQTMKGAIAVLSRVSGLTFDELLALRVEGFFAVRDGFMEAARQERGEREREENPSCSIPSAPPINPEKHSRWMAVLADADARAREN